MLFRSMDLILNVKKKYFDEIKVKTKHYEYREIKPYWTKRLNNKRITGIQIRLGYPKNTDTSKIQWFPWRGKFETSVVLMGEGRKDVYAMELRSF